MSTDSTVLQRRTVLQGGGALLAVVLTGHKRKPTPSPSATPTPTGGGFGVQPFGTSAFGGSS